MLEQTTVDHEEIKAWAKRHGLKPALIETEGLPGEKKGLRFDAPGNKDEALLTEAKQSEDVAWGEFFAEFDAQGLALQYTDQVEDPTQAYQFVPRSSLGE